MHKSYPLRQKEAEGQQRRTVPPMPPLRLSHYINCHKKGAVALNGGSSFA